MSTTAFKIKVIEPCTQNWDSMSHNELGKYCQSCLKTVIDFSSLREDEINSYFQKNWNSNLCGRFKLSQIENVKVYIGKKALRKSNPIWKKFLVVLFICFGSSLFHIDFVLLGFNNLQAQTILTTNSKFSSKKKSKSKKVRKTKFSTFKLERKEDLEIMVLGNIGFVPDYSFQYKNQFEFKLNKTKTEKRRLAKNKHSPLKQNYFLKPPSIQIKRKNKKKN